MPSPWEGKHIWIWYLDQCGESPQEIVAQAVRLGLSGLLVKAWDGSSFWPQIKDIISPAHAAGLLVGAWGYSYGTSPWEEAKAARQAMAAGADWLIIDAEQEYDHPRGREMAKRMQTVFRGIFPATPIGFTSFGIPSLHPDFPYDAFWGWCDVFMPQVYWGLFDMPVNAALARSIGDCQRMGMKIRMAPVGQCYGNVRVDDITRFGELAENAGLPGISYYDWQHASSGQLLAVGAAPYERRVPKVADTAPEWQRKIIEDALTEGLITQHHDPTEVAPKWFVLETELNLLRKVKQLIQDATATKKAG